MQVAEGNVGKEQSLEVWLICYVPPPPVEQTNQRPAVWLQICQPAGMEPPGLWVPKINLELVLTAQYQHSKLETEQNPGWASPFQAGPYDAQEPSFLSCFLCFCVSIPLSEYQLAKPSDSHRKEMLFGSLAKPGHPMGKFCWGECGKTTTGTFNPHWGPLVGCWAKTNTS